MNMDKLTYEELSKENDKLRKQVSQLTSQKDKHLYFSQYLRRLVFDNSRMPSVIMDVNNYQFIECNPAATAAPWSIAGVAVCSRCRSPAEGPQTSLPARS